ncbi:antibiotic biosynthesis monooxygenase family protein [Streptomyces sp. NPDC001982]|uniref:putative quinol monooxygenase n=1 Tax=unclassified Streptomyces TaxID=2593676 RepID=UPI00332FA4D5
MSEKIDALFTYRIKPGMEERFQAYLDKMLPVIEAEPYVLEYEIFQGDDGTYYQHERFENEAAMWRHMEVIAEGQADRQASTEMLSLTVLGKMSQKYWDTFGAAAGSVAYERFRQIAR